MPRIDDGHATLITFALLVGSGALRTFWEKEVTPPGLQGGGENDITTMHNVTYRTRASKHLITLSECSFVAAYDPAFYTEILDMLNKNQLITITFPDGSKIAFYGWLDEFTPGRNVEGSQPTAEAKIIPSNTHSTTGVETPPVFTAAP